MGDDISKATAYAITKEGINARDKQFTEFYLNETKPVFGIIGFKYAIGMQEEILKKCLMTKLLLSFIFVNVYKKPAVNPEEIAMRSGAVHYPLGMSLFDANSMTEDQIIDNILNND